MRQSDAINSIMFDRYLVLPRFTKVKHTRFYYFISMFYDYAVIKYENLIYRALYSNGPK